MKVQRITRNKHKNLIVILDSTYFTKEIEKYNNENIIRIDFEERIHQLTPYKAKAIRKNADDFKGLAHLTDTDMLTLLKEYKDYTLNFVSFSLSALYILRLLPQIKNLKIEKVALISPSVWYVHFFDRFEKEIQNINHSTKFLLLNSKEEGKGKPDPICHMNQNLDQLYNLFLKHRYQIQRYEFDLGHGDFLFEKFTKSMNWILEK